MKNKKILICYDYFTPAYKAGGPIVSLNNLVKLISNDYQVFVFATSQDLDGELLGVESDIWGKTQNNLHIFYCSPQKRNYKHFKSIVDELNPDIVYINGMFSFFSTINPLRYSKKHNIKVVISPRGMLQNKSLQQKKWKKKIYLFWVNHFFLKKINPYWHFTTLQEQEEFVKTFPDQKRSAIIGNVPTIVNFNINSYSINISSPIKFLTVALISPMKNHKLVLEALMKIKGTQIKYDIYGPVKEQKYWDECLQIIRDMPQNISIQYKGSISPNKLDKMYPKYHFYIQPSQSENFGHAIFEAMASGIPVIISNQTPWKNLEEQEAGWDVDLADPEPLSTAVSKAVSMNQEGYSKLSKGARALAQKYIDGNDLKADYRKLFSV